MSVEIRVSKIPAVNDYKARQTHPKEAIEEAQEPPCEPDCAQQAVLGEFRLAAHMHESE